MSRFLRLTLVLVAGWLAVPSAASATTVHQVIDDLTFPRSTPNRGCEHRTLQTGPGKYHWRVFSAFVGAEHQKQWKGTVIRLPKDTYSWYICWRPAGNKVLVFSTLSRYVGGPIHRLNGDLIKGSFGSGRYHMGTTLDNLRG